MSFSIAAVFNDAFALSFCIGMLAFINYFRYVIKDFKSTGIETVTSEVLRVDEALAAIIKSVGLIAEYKSELTQSVGASAMIRIFEKIDAEQQNIEQLASKYKLDVTEQGSIKKMGSINRTRDCDSVKPVGPADRRGASTVDERLAAIIKSIKLIVEYKAELEQSVGATLGVDHVGDDGQGSGPLASIIATREPKAGRSRRNYVA
jgi:hypothetical protein